MKINDPNMGWGILTLQLSHQQNLICKLVKFNLESGWGIPTLKGTTNCMIGFTQRHHLWYNALVK